MATKTTKLFQLLVNNKWRTAMLTIKQANDIICELKGRHVINEQYNIPLTNGDIVDLGIVDDIRFAKNI